MGKGKRGEKMRGEGMREQVSYVICTPTRTCSPLRKTMLTPQLAPVQPIATRQESREDQWETREGFLTCGAGGRNTSVAS